MVLAAPGPLLTPPPTTSPSKTPHRSNSGQTRSQNEKKNPPPIFKRTRDGERGGSMFYNGSTPTRCDVASRRVLWLYKIRAAYGDTICGGKEVATQVAMIVDDACSCPC